MQRIIVVLIAVAIVIVASGCCGQRTSCTRGPSPSACSDVTRPADEFQAQTAHFDPDRPVELMAPVVFTPPAD